MAMVGIRYGSDESVVMAGEVARRLNVGAFKASVDMAERHGAFPIFKLHKEIGHPWIERLLDACGPETREKFVKFGRRNISLTTIAPTGTVSIMTQSTSGVEPVFMPYYTRRRKLSDHEIAQGLSVDFVDQSGDKWHEYPVFHHELRNWLIVQGVQSPEALNTDELRQWTMRSPYWGATAMDQQWEKGVEIQAACQLWISHSISRTANLPNDAPVELVDRIYRAAWASGCKGYTVYRDGSRSGVLVSADQSTVETTIPFNDAPKRPEVLPVDVHHVRYKGEEWTVLVGLLEGEPFEVFAGPVEDLPVPPSVQQAEVRKHARKSRGARYELVWDDGQKNVRDIAKALEAEHNTLTRLTSLSLRHGAKIQFVVEQLQRDESSFLSFSRVLARTLKTYIPEGTKASQAAFSDCSTPELCEPVYSEGCLSCKGCGKSKCG
jgi:ribonucleoside-diphosphate reductase alpha chain